MQNPTRAMAEYFGFAVADTEPKHAGTGKQQTRRLVTTAATGTAATAAVLGLMWGGLATPATAANGYGIPADAVRYEGASVNIDPDEGTGGLYFRDENGNITGLASEADTLGIQGCHPTDPTKAYAVQLTHGHLPGEGTQFEDGWGASGGYINYQQGHTEGNEPVPCGG